MNPWRIFGREVGAATLTLLGTLGLWLAFLVLAPAQGVAGTAMAGFYRAPITPGQTWFSPTGGGNVPAASGTITTYLAGTSTLVATFADNTGLTSNGSQITLNSVGRLPNIDIWIPGGVAIKMVILDAAGQPIQTVDNITGENDPAFASGSFSQWIDGPAATWINATTFTSPGDQVTSGPLSIDRRIEITSGAGVTRATIASSAFDVPTNLTTVTFTKDTNDPAPTNPITGLRYGVLSVEATSFPSAALQLGAPRHRVAGNTNVQAYGPIGSNLVTFTVPPNVVAAAGGAGDRQVTGTVNGVAGSLTFNKTAHGRTTGQAVQLTVNVPANTALLTTYIVFVVDADNYGLYAVPAGWQFEQPYMDPVTVPGGLTWGNPIAFGGAAGGATTVTPGFVAPVGVTRVLALTHGAGGGGGGGRGSTGTGGQGTDGGTTTFSTMTAPGGNGAGGGTTTRGGILGAIATIASGGTINTTGNIGYLGIFNAGDNANQAPPGGSGFYGGTRFASTTVRPLMGSGGNGGNTQATNQGTGASGNSGTWTIGWLTVLPGTFIAATCGTGGTGGTAGTGTNSSPGGDGGNGFVEIRW